MIAPRRAIRAQSRSVTMHSILWNAALPAKKGDSLAYSYAGMSTPSDPSYRDDPSRVTGEKHQVSAHASDMAAIFS